MSTGIVCDSDAILYLHNHQISSEGTAKLSQQIWVQIAISVFLFFVRGCSRESSSRANTTNYLSFKVVAHSTTLNSRPVEENVPHSTNLLQDVPIKHANEHLGLIVNARIK